MKNSTRLILVSLFLFGILVWETQGRKHDFFRPTDLLLWITGWLEYFYRELGVLVVYMSAFLTWLDLKELGQSLTDIVWRLLGLLFSFYVFFVAYYEAASAYLNQEGLIITGTVLLVSSTTTALIYRRRLVSLAQSQWVQWTRKTKK